jgi:hypothetical protein
MSILQIEHAVRDYDAWKTAFDSDPVGRERGGVRRYRILRPAEDPNYVIIELEFDSASEADDFRAALLGLWDRVEDSLGLEQQQARILEVAESTEY